MEVKRRIFLVGCPRSGTTVLQAAIATHSQITSFPETSFFQKAVRQPRRRFGYNRTTARKFGRDHMVMRILEGRYKFLTEELKPTFIAHPQANGEVTQLLTHVGRPELAELYPNKSLMLKPKIDGFVRILDRLAIDRGKEMWLEKTPSHVLYLDVIEKYVPAPMVVHIVRRGTDVIASLVDAKTKYTAFRKNVKRPIRLDRLITLWNRCHEESMKRQHQVNHLVISYEELIDEPEVVLRRLCSFLAVDFEQGMLLGEDVDLKIIAAKGPAKRSIAEGFRPPEDKFSRLFSSEEQNYILANLASRG